MKTLSIIIPIFNERSTIAEIVKRVEAVDFGDNERELIIVDDGSSDGAREILKNDISPRHKIIFHDRNKGKGAAILTGIENARGDFFVVQDADLEYDPNDLPSLARLILDGVCEVCYGSRVLGRKRKKYSSLLFHWGGLIVTWWTNLLYGSSLTDEATCYKMFTRRVFDSITLVCHGFEFCPEFTGKVLKAGYKIKEVSISYFPRGKKQGKKIKIRDGFIALWTLLRIRFF